MQLTPTFKVKTPPATEPVSVDDVRSQMNADITDDGGKVTRVLTAAREMFESHSGVSVMPTVWQCFLDRFPYSCDLDYDQWGQDVRLMRGPVSAVGSVIYTDASGDSQTLSTSLYQSDVKRTPARVRPAFGQAWPVVRSSTFNTVTIEFTAGFTSTALIPKKAIQAILMLAAYWIENPSMEGQVAGDVASAYWALSDAVHWEVFDE